MSRSFDHLESLRLTIEMIVRSTIAMKSTIEMSRGEPKHNRHERRERRSTIEMSSIIEMILRSTIDRMTRCAFVTDSRNRFLQHQGFAGKGSMLREVGVRWRVVRCEQD